MHTTAIRSMATGILLLTCFILISCSGDNAPQQGTPAFYWAAAKETFAAKDYSKTVQHLERLTATDNEYSARARPWLLVMTSGMARGYMDLADSFEAGSRANKDSPTEFRRRTNAYRGAANRLAVEFVEVFDKFQKGKDDPVPIAMGFPTGNITPVVQLTRASTGTMLLPAELEPAEKRAMERGVLLATCGASGAPEDPARTQELLRPGTLQVPRAAFVTAMASTLFDEAQLYSVRKLDDSGKRKIFCTRALDALKTVPENKQTKDLSTKITKSLKIT
jgi:hypothetical protein